MIAITSYTSYASVRALIGVDADELTDTTLSNEVFALALETVLHREVPSHNIGAAGSLFAKYAAIAAKQEQSRTAEEVTLYGLIRFYAACVVADTAIPGLTMFAKRSESDGKASATRFSAESTHRDVVELLRGKMAWALSAIRSVGVISIVSSLPLLVVVSPEVNITEESVREST